MVAGDRVRREYVGEGLWALPKQGKYKWYYLKDHSPEEVVFLKVADSREDVQTRCTFCPFLKNPIPFFLASFLCLKNPDSPNYLNLTLPISLSLPTPFLFSLPFFSPAAFPRSLVKFVV